MQNGSLQLVVKIKNGFYYDLNKNYSIDWGNTFDIYKNQALIQLGEYLYIFDTINNKKNYSIRNFQYHMI